MAEKFYSVRKGKIPGIYKNWDDCKKQVIGFKGAEYKKFNTLKEAESFMDGDSIKTDFLESEEDISSLKDNEIIAYVDGSFNLKDFKYSFGAVLLDRFKETHLNGVGDDKSLAEMRNVSGELKGAMEAMKASIDMGKKKLYLHYDYAGIENWAKGEWKTNKEGTRKYKEFYDSIKDDLEVVFIKVPAHTGIKYNELADTLAKEAFK